MAAGCASHRGHRGTDYAMMLWRGWCGGLNSDCMVCLSNVEHISLAAKRNSCLCRRLYNKQYKVLKYHTCPGHRAT